MKKKPSLKPLTIESCIKDNWPWMLPLILLALITPFTPYLDLHISNRFFDHTTNSFNAPPFALFLYNFGELPAWGLVFSGIMVYTLSFFKPSWKRYRKSALFLLVTYVLVAGIIVNVILKDHWGRPRPRQIEQFGGTARFQPYFKPNFEPTEEDYKSFPSGHATMGFFFVTLGIIGFRIKKGWLAWTGFATALILGSLLGWARIAQGGHFFSDILISLFITIEVALLMNWLIEEP